MKFMHIALVRNQGGHAAINWFGVFTSSLIVAGLAISGAAAFMVAVNWFSWSALLVSAALSLTIVVGGGVRRGLQLPIEQLPPIP
ncbi:hypothetical protein [Aporhodopirellula aestuarii]|uniref:Uncharacterized protein n=1 Tax=Aporhodopirellula aestuarii TaxID=2950107 RepID=A0ABT0UCF9_9BACT|nr:hypothetical protein [Aporhodopirellula aestuarii]MCM2374713.1 hypothetical protein [Aporhodopirellula aestuarii]